MSLNVHKLMMPHHELRTVQYLDLLERREVSNTSDINDKVVKNLIIYTEHQKSCTTFSFDFFSGSKSMTS